jgi:hypothetical protein
MSNGATNWYAVYYTATGALFSIGSAPLADPLPAGMAALTLTAQPDLSQVMWDQATLAFVAIPAPEPDPQVTLMQNYQAALAAQAPAAAAPAAATNDMAAIGTVAAPAAFDPTTFDTSNFVNNALLYLVSRELERETGNG